MPVAWMRSLLQWRWFGLSRAIRARVRGAVVYVRLRVVQHCLAPAHCGGVLFADLELMPHPRQLLPSFGFHTGLDQDVATAARAHREARRLKGSLYVHSVVHNI